MSPLSVPPSPLPPQVRPPPPRFPSTPRPPLCRPPLCRSCGSALGTATQSLPVQDTASKLLGSGQTEILNDATAPAKGLLGGLPAGGMTTSGLSTNGLPLGG